MKFERLLRTEQIYTVKIPFAAKLLLQELMSMGIGTRLIPNRIRDRESAEETGDGGNDGSTFTSQDPTVRISELMKYAVLANPPSKSLGTNHNVKD